MVAWFMTSVVLAGNPAPTKNPFVWEVPSFAVDKIAVLLTVPKEHALYADRLVIRATKGVLGPFELPEAKLRPDPTKPGRLRASWVDDVVFEVPIEQVDNGEVVLELEQQGCGKGLCWPIAITTHTVRVTLTKGT